MAEGATFHGVDLGWMQAQWRDCADKQKQLTIFRDMTGGKATVQQILEAVGEPDYCGPLVSRSRDKWTAEDEAAIVRMADADASNAEIAAALGRSASAVGFKLNAMRKRGIEIPERSPKRGGRRKTAAAADGADDDPDVPVDGADDDPDVPVDGAVDIYPDGAALPLEIGELPGKDALEAVAATLRALLDEEEMLRSRQKVVGGMILEYRQKLGELLEMAGGGLTDGKD